MTILFCTDFSDNAQRAFKEAVFLARSTGGQITALHVIPGLYTAEEGRDPDVAAREHPDAPKALERLQAQCLSEPDLEVRGALRHGNETKEIMDVAAAIGADVIVIGASGLGAVGRFFGGGGVAEHVLHNARIPILIVPPT